jgi:hypothetical protein
MLTEDSNWPEKQRKMVGDEVRAAETATLVGNAVVGGSGSLGRADRSGNSLRK